MVILGRLIVIYRPGACEGKPCDSGEVINRGAVIMSKQDIAFKVNAIFEQWPFLFLGQIEPKGYAIIFTV